MKEQNVCFSLICRKTKKKDELEHAPKIESFLEKFQDIIYNNVPIGLTPMRDIIHCMDQIPRASFSNKAPHKLTCDAMIELNIQVKEFLENHFIREYLSPCVVPIMLVPKKNREWQIGPNSEL